MEKHEKWHRSVRSVSTRWNTHSASHGCAWLLKKWRPALTLQMDQHLYIRPAELASSHAEPEETMCEQGRGEMRKIYSPVGRATFPASAGPPSCDSEQDEPLL
jgi:hypothetical protein